VRATIDAGFPAARVFPESSKIAESHPNEIRMAFDGDAVLFSDEAEQFSRRKVLKPLLIMKVKK
jgi:5'-nucleotidase